MKFYKAIIDSRRFHIEAYAENETQANEHLKKGLNNHAKDYQMPLDWWSKLKLVDPILIRAIGTII